MLLDHYDSAELIQEVEIMKKIDSNDHVVCMFGCNISQIPHCILLEYAQCGDLKAYLIDVNENVS